MLSKTVFHGIATSSLVFSFPKTHTFSLKGRPCDIYKYRITVSLFYTLDIKCQLKWGQKFDLQVFHCVSILLSLVCKAKENCQKSLLGNPHFAYMKGQFKISGLLSNHKQNVAERCRFPFYSRC